MIVQTDKGRLEGATTREGITVFKGVPYAAPPVAALRWKPPQPVISWRGVRPALAFGKACIQPALASLDGAEPVGEQSEDCLYLNIWTAGTAAADKPVLVWLHGGGFRTGDGASSLYDGTPLARRDAVVVTLNYRIGHLGFFAHPALEREYPAGPVNFGLLDQIAALDWVQRNIASFGGDPRNVTIFGHASGAASVLALFASPMTGGLFHRGIAQSAYALPEHTRDHAVAVGFDIANRGWGLGPHATLAQLMALPAQMFARIRAARPNGGPAPLISSLAPVAVAGDDVLPRGVRGAFEDGDQHALPLILGNTSDDASVLAALGLDPAEILALLGLAPDALDELARSYLADGELAPDACHDARRLGMLVARDALFTMHARWIATQHARRADARRYYFGYVPELLRADQPRGAAHGDDLVFAFDTGDLALATGGTFTNRDRVHARQVSDYWVSFARTGTPAGAVDWPRHEGDADRVLTLGDTIGVERDFRRGRLEHLAACYPAFARRFDD